MASKDAIKEVPFQPRGAAYDLFFNLDPEILIEGPAGTGKTRAVLERINQLCEMYPGIRVLMCRQTLKSLKESVLVTWEERVLWPNHPIWRYSGSASRENRTHYTYPPAKNVVDGRVYEGSSHIVLGGLTQDDAEKTFSTEYDVVAVFEAIQVSKRSWELLLRVNRNWKMPFQQAIADTNPGPAGHWLNQRARQPYVLPTELVDVLPAPRPGQTQMTRLRSVHTDNPALFEHVPGVVTEWRGRQYEGRWTEEGAQYLQTLSRMSGAALERLFRGEWVTAEGLVYPEWDRDKHIVSRENLPEHFDHYLMGADWGFDPDPGCLQLWGVLGTKLYLLKEQQKLKERPDWWAALAVGWAKEVGLEKVEAVVCDPSEPAYIVVFNSRISHAYGRDMREVAVKGNNAIKTGVGLMGDKIKALEMYVVEDYQQNPDPELEERGFSCFVDEIEAYTWAEKPDKGGYKEKPDESCEDHSMDTARYVVAYHWGKEPDEEDVEPEREVPSFAQVLRHEEKLREARLRRMGVRSRRQRPRVRDI